MKKHLLLLSSLYMAILSADTYVNGYTKANGTYVEGHYRSSPNDTVSDNYSTDGNENPYTGEEGNREVYDDGGYENADDSGENYSTSQQTSSGSNTPDSDNTGLLILGVIGGFILLFTILRGLGSNMFFSYLAANRKTVFWLWIGLTLLNQIVFFGACLAPYCILASIPHVSLITFGIMYLSYKSALTTYDSTTGYNQFGYDKDGYDKDGYGSDGYDKHGYNVKGFDRNGKDREGKGSIGRFFAGQEYHAKTEKLNQEAIQNNAELQTKLILDRLPTPNENKDITAMDTHNKDVASKGGAVKISVEDFNKICADLGVADLNDDMAKTIVSKREELAAVRAANKRI